MIAWALKQLFLWGAVAAVIYAVAGHRLLDRWPKESPPQGTAAVARPEPGRGGAPNSLVYRADQRGHVMLDAVVNGAPVRFMVDTGATFVALTMRDAEAAGISRSSLVFDRGVSTANGVARVAMVKLRELRIGQFSASDVPATVHERLNVSLLGHSFLKRLDSYEMRDGVLTLNYW